MIVSACEKAREETGIDTVALSGGVYQNRLLLDYSVTMLEKRGFHVQMCIRDRQWWDIVWMQKVIAPHDEAPEPFRRFTGGF